MEQTILVSDETINNTNIIPNLENHGEQEEILEHLGVDDNAPWSVLKTKLRTVADAYFTSKPFESEELYEDVGVRFYKKYLPTSGDLVVRKIWTKLGDQSEFIRSSEKEREGDIRGFEKSTRVLETIHLGFTALFGALDFDSITSGDPKLMLRHTSFQLLVNIYPIMLQRYNRLRLNRVLSKLESSSETAREIAA